MSSDYLTDEEYNTYWFRLGELRSQIAEGLGLQNGMKVLDVGTGWGLFALEMARQLNIGEIIGIDMVYEELREARKLAVETELESILSFRRMDATRLSFPDSSFDLVGSFLGMRDIHMTRGEGGVKRAVEEMIRVVKPRGKIALCVTPPEDMETEDQRLAIKVEGEVFEAKSMPKKFYLDIFQENDMKTIETRAFATGKKLTANQTKIEIAEGIQIARHIYGKRVPGIKRIWEDYGESIEAFGYGMYSKIVQISAQKD
jgi:ubiquinone/menaquinone biosynthesis C-methylase UbiE